MGGCIFLPTIGIGGSRLAFAIHEGEDGISSFLPALRVWRGEVFAQDPIIRIPQHVSFDALGIHDVRIEFWIVRGNARSSYLRNKKSTPRHGNVPSLNNNFWMPGRQNIAPGICLYYNAFRRFSLVAVCRLVICACLHFFNRCVKIMVCK